MAVGAVKHSVTIRRPSAIRCQCWPARVNAPSAHLALGGLFFVHGYESEIGGHRQDYYLKHGFSRSKNMGAAHGRRLEYDERDHRPPLGAQQRRDRDRYRAGCIGIEARMWLGPNCPLLAYLEIEKKLIGVIFAAEAAKRRPLQIALCLWSKITVENPFAVFFRNPQFVFIRVKELDSILRPLGEWGAMPGVFVRIIGARLGLTGPAGHFYLGAPRRQSGIDQPE